jgi:hypothetical protein
VLELGSVCQSHLNANCCKIPVVSQFEFLSQSVGRVARLSGNVRQPNQVIDD